MLPRGELDGLALAWGSVCRLGSQGGSRAVFVVVAKACRRARELR